jgi:hypothetical protein
LRQQGPLGLSGSVVEGLGQHCWPKRTDHSLLWFFVCLKLHGVLLDSSSNDERSDDFIHRTKDRYKKQYAWRRPYRKLEWTDAHFRLFFA